MYCQNPGPEVVRSGDKETWRYPLFKIPSKTRPSSSTLSSTVPPPPPNTYSDYGGTESLPLVPMISTVLSTDPVTTRDPFSSSFSLFYRTPSRWSSRVGGPVLSFTRRNQGLELSLSWQAPYSRSWTIMSRTERRYLGSECSRLKLRRYSDPLSVSSTTILTKGNFYIFYCRCLSFDPRHTWRNRHGKVRSVTELCPPDKRRNKLAILLLVSDSFNGLQCVDRSSSGHSTGPSNRGL